MLPCFLNIEAADQKVLDTFANARIIRVCLKRRINYTRNASLVLARFKANSRGKGSSLRQDEMTEIVEDVGQAVWWVPSNAAFYGPSVRCLEGEIHLPKDLYPSCMVPFLIVEVGPATKNTLIPLNKLLISNIASTVLYCTFHRHF